MLSSLHESINLMLIDIHRTESKVEKTQKKLSHLRFTSQLEQSTCQVKLSLVLSTQLNETLLKKSKTAAATATEVRKLQRSLFALEQQKLNAHTALKQVNQQIKQHPASILAEAQCQLVLATELVEISCAKLK